MSQTEMDVEVDAAGNAPEALRRGVLVANVRYDSDYPMTTTLS